MMKVIFMGTPDFAVPTLERIAEDGHDVKLVITQQDKKRGRGKKLQFTPVKEKAAELGIDVYQPENVNSEESIEKIREADPDVIVVVAYGQIMKKDILDMPKYGCLNVHASLLPKYRGAAPINWVIINGEKKSGNTIMRMNEGLDTGNMISKSEIEIGRDMNAGELHDILMADGAELLSETLKNLEKENIEGEVQDDSLSCYAPMMDKSLGRIDWEKSNEDIFNLIRGTQPWPGSFFDYNGETVKVKKAEVSDKKSDKEPGTIISVDNSGIAVAAGEGVIVLKEIQFPGKRAMSVEDYLRGNEIEKTVLR